MALQLKTFEKLAGVLELVRGTAVTPPDHYLNLKGTVAFDETRVAPEDSDGLMTQTRRSIRVREWSNFDATGPADVAVLPWLLNLIVKGGVTTGVHPTTPTGVLSYQWVFQETLTADDVATATLYFGDPNVQIWQAPFNFLDSLDITGDGAGTGLTTVAVKGRGARLSKVAAPTWPAFVTGPLIVPTQMSAWLDTSSAIGTTSILGRIVSAKHTIPLNGEPLFLPAGPGGPETITTLDRGKREITTTVTMIVPDSTQFDTWEADTLVKLRVRHNGPKIETITSTDYYNYVQVDTYGKLQKPTWGTVGKSASTVTFTVTSEYQASVGGGWTITVMNTSAAL